MTLSNPIRSPLDYADDLAELAALLRAWTPGETVALDAARLTLDRVSKETSDWSMALLFLADHEAGPQVATLIARLETMASDLRAVMAPGNAAVWREDLAETARRKAAQ